MLLPFPSPTVLRESSGSGRSCGGGGGRRKTGSKCYSISSSCSSVFQEEPLRAAGRQERGCGCLSSDRSERKKRVSFVSLATPKNEEKLDAKDATREWKKIFKGDICPSFSPPSSASHSFHSPSSSRVRAPPHRRSRTRSSQQGCMPKRALVFFCSRRRRGRRRAGAAGRAPRQAPSPGLLLLGGARREAPWAFLRSGQQR